MIQLKKRLGIALVICLSGCDTAPTIKDVPQNRAFFVERTITDQDGIDHRVVMIDESVCLVREYRHSREFVGPVGVVEERDLMECNNLTGYLPDTYLEVTEFFEDVRQYINDNADRCRR